LLEVAGHYSPSSLKKEEIHQKILEHLQEEEFISEDKSDELEMNRTTSRDWNFKRRKEQGRMYYV